MVGRGGRARSGRDVCRSFPAVECEATPALENDPGMVLSPALNRSRGRLGLEVPAIDEGEAMERKLGLLLAKAASNGVLSVSKFVGGDLGGLEAAQSSTRSRWACADDLRAASVENVPGLLVSR